MGVKAGGDGGVQVWGMAERLGKPGYALFLGPLLTALAMFSLAMLASTHNLQSILSQTRTPAVTT